MDCTTTVKLGPFAAGANAWGVPSDVTMTLGARTNISRVGFLMKSAQTLCDLRQFRRGPASSSWIRFAAWWHGLSAPEQHAVERVQLETGQNGPESSGVRTQFLHRLVQFVGNAHREAVQVVIYPLYPGKYNPIERCWGILELHWNGTLLHDTDTMLEWAKSMTWKGIKPVVELSRNVYAKGVTLSKSAMHAVEARVERNPLLPKWDILISPTGTT